MNVSTDRPIRWIARGLLVFALCISPATMPTLRAQAPEEAAPAGEGEKGRPLDGYLATLCLVLLALFIVGKSARR
jgi:hypothetical protein